MGCNETIQQNILGAWSGSETQTVLILKSPIKMKQLCSVHRPNKLIYELLLKLFATKQHKNS